MRDLDILLEIPNLGLADGYGQSAFSLAKIFIDICAEENLTLGILNKKNVCDPIERTSEFVHYNSLIVDKTEIGKVNIFLRYSLPEYERWGSKFSIAMTMFETDAVPSTWVDPLNVHNLVVTPTKWGKEIFQKYIKTPVVDIPLPVYTDYYQIQNFKNILKPASNKFRFIAVGHFMLPDRKRHIHLIDAFHKKFKGTNAELYVKTSWIGKECQHQNRIDEFAVGKENIILDLDNNISSKEMLGMYLSSHCGLWPSQGEGFGLPQAEIALLGRPLVVADNSAMTTMKEYFPWVSAAPCTSIPSDYSPQQINCKTGHWANCDMEDFLNRAESIYQSWEENKSNFKNLIWESHTNNKLRNFISHESIKEKFRIIIKAIMEKA
jgi:hypothetical protein